MKSSPIPTVSWPAGDCPRDDEHFREYITRTGTRYYTFDFGDGSQTVDDTVNVLTQARKLKVTLHGRDVAAGARADSQRRAQRREGGRLRDPGRRRRPQGTAGRRARRGHTERRR